MDGATVFQRSAQAVGDDRHYVPLDDAFEQREPLLSRPTFITGFRHDGVFRDRLLSAALL